MRMLSGPAWRIASSGTKLCFLERICEDGTALITSRVGAGWAKRPMRVAAADVFVTRNEARAEYRRRRHIATHIDPHASLNLTTAVP